MSAPKEIFYPVEKLKIKQYKNPQTGKWSCDLLCKRPKTWGVYFKDLSREYLKEILMKNFGISITKIKGEKYIWKKRKNGGFGWVKQG